MLEVEALSAFYGDVPALFEVGLEAKTHEITAIVGGNGAGKTTLLKTISGLISRRKGSINFKGEAILGMLPHEIVERGIIHVPEGRKVFPSLTVLENLELGSYHKKAKRYRGTSLNQVYDLFPVLKTRSSQTAKTLSGGELQMLAIARGMMGLPELLMFDEPSLGLAPLMIKLIFSITKSINDLGTSIMLVEQNTLHSLSICHHGYVLKNGRVILHGSGQDLLKDNEVKRAYLGM